MIRIAAVGDIHLDESIRDDYRERLTGIEERADILLVAGDLTRHGTCEEGRVVVDVLREPAIPVVVVLGNHDYHSGQEGDITAMLSEAGITVLEGTGTVIDCGGTQLGVAGGKGFCGGFAGACASDFGEPEMKAFIRHTKDVAGRLRGALADLDADLRVSLTHYAPVKDTLAGEPVELFPFLGSYLLAEAIDAVGADLAIHGHAHLGTEKGMTPGGVRVRNTALPVLGQAYAVYVLDGWAAPDGTTAAGHTPEPSKDRLDCGTPGRVDTAS